MDQQIGINCPDIDVVIGGHSNTFLYNGPEPDVEKVEGPYPMVVTQKSGKKVPVAQAYAYTKYLGHLKLNVSTAKAIIYVLVGWFVGWLVGGPVPVARLSIGKKPRAN